MQLGRWRWWPHILAAGVAVALYANTLGHDFVYDDNRAILSNDDVVGDGPLWELLAHDYWGTPLHHAGSHGSYRPLTVLSFRLTWAATAGRARDDRPASPASSVAWAFHAGNVALHAASAAALVATARRLAASATAAALAGILFAAHPAHSEAVAGVVGRADLAAGLLVLLALLTYTSQARKGLASHAGSAHNGVTRRRATSAMPTLPDEASNLKRRYFSSDISSHTTTSILNTTNSFSVLPNPPPIPVLSLPTPSSTCSTFTSQPFSNGSRGRAPLDTPRGRRELVWTVGLAVAAMLAKEQGIMVLPLCAVYEILYASGSPFHLMRGLFNWKLAGGSGKTLTRAREVQRRRIRWSLQCLAVSFFAAVALRAVAVRGWLPEFATADNPAAKSDSLLTRTLTFLFLPAFNAGLLLFPRTLSFDWSMDAVPLVRSGADPRNAASVALYSAFLCLLVRHLQRLRRARDALQVPSVSMVDVNANHECHGCGHKCDVGAGSPKKALRTSGATPCCAPAPSKRRAAGCPKDAESDPERTPTPDDSSRLVVMALAMMVLPFLPATNLVAYVGFVVAERVLYVPAMGYCLLLGHGLSALWRRAAAGAKRRGAGRGARAAPAAVAAAAALLVAALAARTLQRCADWRDEESLYRSGLAVNPPKAYGNLGNVLSMNGRLKEAEHCYRVALKHRPNMADVHYNLGILLQNTQRWEEAIASYQAAIAFRPHLAAAHLNLGLALHRVGRGAEAQAALRACATLHGARTKDPRAHELARAACRFQLGRLAMDDGRPRDALRAFQDAVAAMPPHYQPQSLYNLMGEAHSRLGHDAEAERWFRAALSSKPDHVPAHLTYGRLLARNASRLREAERWYRRAEALAPEDASVFRHYGQFLLSQRRPAEAAPKLLRALALTQPEPPLYEDAVNAATALRLAGDLAAAEEHYRLAVRLRPQEASGLANLGALYHLRGRLQEAEHCYERALQLQPGDAVTEANLRRLRRLQSAARDAPVANDASGSAPAPGPAVSTSCTD